MDLAIEAADLTKHFGDVVALEGVDLQVPAGTVFGLLGPNGAGKTTAVRILTTILRSDGGQARVLGLDVAREPEAVRRVIGLAGQYAAVDQHLTGRENLRLAGWLTELSRPDRRVRADELLERFGLADAADRPVRTYSGGMRRRLDLAVALVHRPPVLFLDEPTTGLDPRSRGDLWHVIAELVADGTSLLLTTQYLEEADRLAHRIALVDAGRIVAEGTASDLKRRLGATIIDVGLATEIAAARARQILEVLGPASLATTSHVELRVDDGPRTLPRAVRLLDDAGVAPETISLREPTLDDVFLALTGRPVEAENVPYETPTRGAA